MISLNGAEFKAPLSCSAKRVYDVIKVSADGNCLFRSVGIQLNQDHSTLRKLVVNELLNHIDEYSVLYESREDFLKHIRHVSVDGFWADELEIAALSNVIQMKIKIYLDLSEKAYAVYSPRSRSKGIVRVIYVNGNHYDAIVEKQIRSCSWCKDNSASECSQCKNFLCEFCRHHHICSI